MKAILLVGLILLLAGSALADDGVIEINQQRALEGGLSPGDAAGFPVTIEQSGSYLLTSNLVVTAQDESAIRVMAEDVTINLNGFALLGPRTCTNSGPDISCTGQAGSLAGVRSDGFEGVSVQNGTVTGFAVGILLSGRCRVEHLIAYGNLGDGIQTGENCVISQNLAFTNGAAGFDLGRAAAVRENVAFGNGGRGIRARGDGGTTIKHNIGSENGLAGILCNNGCSIARNVTTRNAGPGVNAGNATLVSGNVSCTNTGAELQAAANSGYTDNVLGHIDATDPLVSGGVFLAPNLCNGSTTASDCTTVP